MVNERFVINSNWNKCELTITKEYGFNQISISNFVKKTIELFLINNYKKVLDLGCGSGRHSIYLSEKGFQVYASDINCSAIEYNVESLGIKNINIMEHSFTKIPYESEFFDVVICTSTLHHAIAKDIRSGINEIYRVLKPGGYFIFDILSKEDESYGLGSSIESGTFIGAREGEENIPHHYTDEIELQGLLREFSQISVNKSIYTLNYFNGKEITSKVFDIMALK